MQHALFVLVDLLGTFAFAISGAVAGRERRLDVFGVYVVAYMTACGGGIVRDACLGAVPPVGISDWRYVACSAVAATMTIWLSPWVELLRQPVNLFDSLGLGLFAVVGVHKALTHGANLEAAIVLGTVTAVGGGVLRDVLLNRVPAILAKDVYALAALVAAIIQAVAEVNRWPIAVTPWFAAGVCFAIRLLAMRYSWDLPVVRVARRTRQGLTRKDRS